MSRYKFDLVVGSEYVYNDVTLEEIDAGLFPSEIANNDVRYLAGSLLIMRKEERMKNGADIDRLEATYNGMHYIITMK